MANIYAAVLPSRKNKDGSYSVLIAVSNQRKTFYLPSGVKISSLSQWRNGCVVGRPDAMSMNVQIGDVLRNYREAMMRLKYSSAMSTMELKEYLTNSMRGNAGMSVIEYGNVFLERLRSEGRDSYLMNMGYTLKYLQDCFSVNMDWEMLDRYGLRRYEQFLLQRGNGLTTVGIRMAHVKALVNSAIADGVVRYDVHPFSHYQICRSEIRDLCLDVSELRSLRDARFEGVSRRRFELARDMFMLSFYCGGMNLIDMLSADWSADLLTFTRHKTARSRRDGKKISLTVCQEAQEIVKRYCQDDGVLDVGYKFSDYGQLRSFITKSLNRIGEDLGFEKRLMFYSARKTFCQIGYELGIPLYVLEYVIGHTVKDAVNRPVFNYLKIMRRQADEAIRCVVDFANGATQDC